MANNLTWQQTYSLAKSQGLSDVDAARSANNWAQQGGRSSDGVDLTSINQYAAPKSWTGEQATAITGQTNPVGSTSAPLSLIPATGVASAAPADTTPKAQASIIPQAATAQAPTYTPYVAQEFDDSVSDGPRSNDLGWVWKKGIKSKQLWDAEQAQAADENYKAYTSDYNQYLQNYKQQQDAIANQNALLPYTQMTAAQQASYGLDETAAKVKANELGYTQAYNRWNTLGYVLPGDEATLGVPAGTPTSDASYRNATLALQTAKSSGGGSGGGGNSGSSGTTAKPTAANQAQEWISANNVNFNSPTDMYAYLVSAMQNGDVNATWGNQIISTLKQLYPGAISS